MSWKSPGLPLFCQKLNVKWLKINHNFRKGEVYERIGDTYLREDDQADSALSYYKQAAKIDSDNYMFQLKQGKCHEKNRNFEESITCYNEAADKSNREVALPLLKLGWALVRIKQYDEGIDTLKAAIEIEPENAD